MSASAIRAERASFGALAAAEAVKMRRTWLVPLTVLGPLGVTLLGVILFLLRRSYIIAPFLKGTKSGWQIVADQLGMLHVFAIGLGAALIASLIADVEHRSHTWKQLFALPASRSGTVIVKFAWGALLLAISSGLMAAGYAAIIAWQGLGPMPWRSIAEAAWLPWLGVLPLFSFQLLMSVTVRNQAVPLALGVITPMFGMGLSAMPPWLPWRLPTEAIMNTVNGGVAGVGGNASASIGAGHIGLLALGWSLLFVGAAAAIVTRRDIA